MNLIMSFRSTPRAALKFLSSEMFFGFGIGIWNLALNFHFRFNHIDDLTIGTLLSIAFLCTAGVSFFSGRLGDAIGYQKVMGIGGLCVGTALLVIALSHTLLYFIIGQLLYGTGLSCIVAMEFPQLLSYVNDHQSKFVYNSAILIYFTSSVLGNLFAGHFADHFSSGLVNNPYKILLLISAAMYILLGIVRALLPRQITRTPGQLRLSHVFFQKNVLSFLLFGLITMTMFNGVMSMLNIILREWHHLSDTSIGIIFACASILGGIVVMLTPLLQAKYRNENIAQGIMLIQAIAIALMAIAKPVFTGILVCIRNMSTNCIYSLVDRPMLESIAIDRRGSYSGLRTCANYIGMSIGVATSGIFISNKNFASLFILIGCLGLVQIFVYRYLCIPHILHTTSSDI
jgi:MFS family permease